MVLGFTRKSMSHLKRQLKQHCLYSGKVLFLIFTLWNGVSQFGQPTHKHYAIMQGYEQLATSLSQFYKVVARLHQSRKFHMGTYLLKSYSKLVKYIPFSHLPNVLFLSFCGFEQSIMLFLCNIFYNNNYEFTYIFTSIYFRASR